MSCQSQPQERHGGSGRGLQRGLCLNHASQLAETLPPEPTAPTLPHRSEWFESGRSLHTEEWDDAALKAEYDRLWTDYRADSAAWATEYTGWSETIIGAILDAPRGDCCPTLTVGGELKHGPVANWTRLGPGCREDAAAAASIAFPSLIPTLSASVKTPARTSSAMEVAHHGNALLHAAWNSIVNTWPVCSSCPKPAPPKQKDDEKVRASVLEALAAHGGGPLSSSELCALGIKGLEKESVKGIMDAMVSENSVTLTRRGPAKLYALPPVA